MNNDASKDFLNYEYMKHILNANEDQIEERSSQLVPKLSSCEKKA